MKIKFILSCLGASLLIAQSAAACVGLNSINYKVGFVRGDKENELNVNLTDPKTGKSKQYLDDIGYLTIHLAVTYLAKSASNDSGGDESKKVDLASSKGIVELIKNRLQVLKDALNSYLTKPEYDSVLAPITNLEKMLSVDKPIQGKTLTNGLESVYSAISKTNTDVRVSSRSSPSEAWGQEQKLSDLIPTEIPTYQIFRGCTDNVGILNPNLGDSSHRAKMPPDELPAFTIK